MADWSVLETDLVRYLRGHRWLVQNGYIEKAHAVLCDPPYGLAFMGKEWDTLGAVEFEAWVSEWAELLIDFVHPGAVGLFFGGTRTYHRLAAGLEDAGWEIADCFLFAWTYGSGFPKSLDLSKALDKEAGAAREVVGVGTSGKNRNVLNAALHPETFGGPFALTAPATPLAARWEGYGTALKPAFEPVVVARAPRGKHTYAALAREFGTGALAIDAARIPANGDVMRRANNVTIGGNGIYQGGKPFVTGDPNGKRWPANFALVCACESDDHAADCPVAVLGAQSGEQVSGTAVHRNGSGEITGHIYPRRAHVAPDIGYADTGTAARFFYQAKAAAWEREAGLHGFAKRPIPRLEGDTRPVHLADGKTFDGREQSQRANHHPTIKPIRLAEYLARLILPPALDTPRRLLVPFAGGGSEMIGALLAGWDVVTGIERETEYVALARARVGWWAQFGTYDAARKAYEQERKAAPQPVIVLPEVTDETPAAQLPLFDEKAV